MGRKDKVLSLNQCLQDSVGARMRYARQQKGISLTDMARVLTYTKSYLSAVENGASKPSSQLIEGYERLLDLAPGYLTRSQSTSSPRQSSPLMDASSHRLNDNGNRGNADFSIRPGSNRANLA